MVDKRDGRPDSILQMWFRRQHPYDSDPEWQSEAACKDHPTEWWYPERGANHVVVGRAKQICRTCPIQLKCLQYALYHNENIGIWGATTPDERRKLRKEQGFDRLVRTRTVNKKPIAENDHGTYAGYGQHVRRGETPCALCRKAKVNYDRKRKWEQKQKNLTCEPSNNSENSPNTNRGCSDS